MSAIAQPTRLCEQAVFHALVGGVPAYTKEMPTILPMANCSDIRHHARLVCKHFTIVTISMIPPPYSSAWEGDFVIDLTDDTDDDFFAFGVEDMHLLPVIHFPHLGM